MRKVINSDWKVVVSMFCAIVLLFSVSAPSVSAAVNQSIEKQSKEMLSKKEMDKIIEKTAREINKEAPRVNEGSHGKYQTFAGGTLAVRLAKIFGGHYIKKKFPRKIYKAFPNALKKNVSEEKWVTIWNVYVLMGPLDEVKNTVADALKPYVWDWVATSCGYIAQGIVYAVI